VSDLLQRASGVLPGAAVGPYVLPDADRCVFVRADGAELHTDDGRTYVDHVGGAGALILGHGHPGVVAAGQAQLATASHLFGVLNPAAIALAERIVAATPCADKVAFATTGSEATAYALRVARAATGRDLVLKFEGAYHGNHDYALVSAFPEATSDYPIGVSDTAGTPIGAQRSMLVARFNDAASVEHILESRRGEVAAIIVECVQRIIPATEEFLVSLRRLCDEHGIVLIFDEVVTGFRIGPASAQGHYGITPDLACFGKVIGGGGPLSCVAGRAELIDLIDSTRRGEPNAVYVNGTLHGNPVAAATTLAVLDEIEQPGFHDSLDAATSELCEGAQRVLGRYAIPAIAVHVGSLWQILFLPAPPRDFSDIRASDRAAMRQLDIELLREGHFSLPGVRKFVSAAHTPDVIADTVDALDRACARLASS